MRIRTYDRDGMLISEEEVGASPRTAEDRNTDTLRELIDASLKANRVFLSVRAPTLDQLTAQVQSLTRETTAIIRLLLGRLDGTD